jgi:hypothetical protein
MAKAPFSRKDRELSMTDAMHDPALRIRILQHVAQTHGISTAAAQQLVERRLRNELSPQTTLGQVLHHMDHPNVQPTTLDTPVGVVFSDSKTLHRLVRSLAMDQNIDYAQAMEQPPGEAPTRLASESSPCPTSKYGRSGAEANGGRRWQCRFASESSLRSFSCCARDRWIVMASLLSVRLGADARRRIKGPRGPDPSGPLGESGKWGRSSPTDYGWVSPVTKSNVRLGSGFTSGRSPVGGPAPGVTARCSITFPHWARRASRVDIIRILVGATPPGGEPPCLFAGHFVGSGALQ